MNKTSKIEIPVGKTTAAALTDARRLAAIGHLVNRLVRPTGDDTLIALLERTSAEAREIGLS